jgi:hypothetical protein
MGGCINKANFRELKRTRCFANVFYPPEGTMETTEENNLSISFSKEN